MLVMDSSSEKCPVFNNLQGEPPTLLFACLRQDSLIYKHIWQIRSLIGILYNPIQVRFRYVQNKMRNSKGSPWVHSLTSENQDVL